MIAALAAAAMGRGAAAADAPVPQTFDISLAQGRRVSGSDTLRVRRGQRVTLNWSTDRPIVLHLHGYDIEIDASPQSPGVMAFTANLPGRFAVSEHGRGKAHDHRAVLYLEVHP